MERPIVLSPRLANFKRKPNPEIEVLTASEAAAKRPAGDFWFVDYRRYTSAGLAELRAAIEEK